MFSLIKKIGYVSTLEVREQEGKSIGKGQEIRATIRLLAEINH